MREKGFALAIYLILLTLISGGVVGGSLYVKNSYPELIDAISQRKGLSSIAKSSAKVSSTTALKTENKTVKSIPPTYIKFNGLCVHFAYPNDYKKTNEAIFDTDSPGPDGVNLYGRSFITVVKGEYQFTLDCYPRIKPDLEIYFKNTEERLKKYTEITEKAGYTGQKSSSVERIKLVGLDALAYTTFADYSGTFLRKGQRHYLGMQGNYVLEVTIEWKNTAGNDPKDPTRKELEDLINYIQLIDIFTDRTNLLFAPTLAPTSKSPLVPSPTTTFDSANSKSNEGVNLGNNVFATLKTISPSNKTVSVSVKFSNVSTSNQTINSKGLQMHDQKLGEPTKELNVQYVLSPGESKLIDVSFDILPNPPFKIIYVMPGDNLILLGSYAPK